MGEGSYSIGAWEQVFTNFMYTIWAITYIYILSGLLLIGLLFQCVLNYVILVWLKINLSWELRLSYALLWLNNGKFYVAFGALALR